MIVNDFLSNGFVAGYAFAKGVIDKIANKTFSSVTLMEANSNTVAPMNNMDFNIIDNILYIMSGDYWSSRGGHGISLIDLNTYTKIEIDYDTSMIPNDCSTCCVYNEELYYLSSEQIDSKYYFTINSCSYNKETGVFSTNSVKKLSNIADDTLDVHYKLLNVENTVFLCYFKDDVFYMVDIDTEEIIAVSGFSKESSNCYLSLNNVIYNNGNIYIAFTEGYTYKILDSHVYYFTYNNTATEISASLLTSFDGAYESYNGASIEGEYSNFLFVQYDFINSNPIAVVVLSDTTTQLSYTKIYDLHKNKWYVENGADLYNISNTQSYYLYDNIISYNNELYLIDYSTGLHKITFDYFSET